MRPATRQTRPMRTADPTDAWARPRLEVLLRSAEWSLGSRMAAYGKVGRDIGRSERWLRRVLGRAGDVTILGRDVFAIRDAYLALCARIEADADRMLAQAAALRGEDDAFHQGGPEMDRGVAAPTSRSTGRAS